MISTLYVFGLTILMISGMMSVGNKYSITGKYHYIGDLKKCKK